jgi:hypothetical protein
MLDRWSATLPAATAKGPKTVHVSTYYSSLGTKWTEAFSGLKLKRIRKRITKLENPRQHVHMHCHT